MGNQCAENDTKGCLFLCFKKNCRSSHRLLRRRMTLQFEHLTTSPRCHTEGFVTKLILLRSSQWENSFPEMIKRSINICHTRNANMATASMSGCKTCRQSPLMCAALPSHKPAVTVCRWMWGCRGQGPVGEECARLSSG